jgi:hypothetical protein
LDNRLDAERLRRAIETAINARATLFTRIVLGDNGEPMQTIDDTETFTLAMEEIPDIDSVKSSLVVPFNIYGDRLFHIRLLRDAKHFYLFVDYHHIIIEWNLTPPAIAVTQPCFGRALQRWTAVAWEAFAVLKHGRLLNA